MTDRFDPNIPKGGPSDPWIEGEFTAVSVVETPRLGKTNLVVNGAAPFDIELKWHVFGNLTPLWLAALSINTQEWDVKVFAEPEGPGTGIVIAKGKVPIGTPPYPQDMAYGTTLTVPANTLAEGDPGNDMQTGVYKIIVTVFLNSALGPVGYDMMGYTEGPIIEVENPE